MSYGVKVVCKKQKKKRTQETHKNGVLYENVNN